MKKFWTMNKSETKTNSAEIFIYGTIGTSWWEESISASQFGRDLQALGNDIEEINVRINSSGGSVYDGLAIRSLLKNHKAYVKVVIDGLAASIASIIAMGADEIIMSLGSQMMIHNPMGSAFGEAKTLREIADLLDKVRDSLVDVYIDKTGMERETLNALLDKEHWMNAHEAVEQGFADKVEGAIPISAQVVGNIAIFNGISMDISKYEHIPKNLSNSIPITLPQNTQVSTPSNQVITTEEDKQMDLNKLKNDFPEVYKQVVNEGITLERKRIQSIDNLAIIPGFEDEIKKEILNKAKYETGVTAEQASIEVNQWISNNFDRILENKAKDEFITNAQVDANSLNDIGGAAAPQNTDNPQEERKAFASGLAGLMNKKRGLVK